MSERHQINSIEFDMWLDGIAHEIKLDYSRETLYDFWVEGYAEWEVFGILV